VDKMSPAKEPAGESPNSATRNEPDDSADRAISIPLTRRNVVAHASAIFSCVFCVYARRQYISRSCPSRVSFALTSTSARECISKDPPELILCRPEFFLLKVVYCHQRDGVSRSRFGVEAPCLPHI